MDDEIQEIVPDPPGSDKTYEQPIGRVTPGGSTPSGKPVALVRTRATDGADDGIYIRDANGAHYRFSREQLASAEAMIRVYLNTS